MPDNTKDQRMAEMTDKEYQKQKRRVQRYIDKWFKPMDLGWYWVDCEWIRERNEDQPATTAITTAFWQYRHATIKWYMPSVADNDDDYLEGIVVHEFVHILVAPLMKVDTQDDLPLQHEFATECLARALRSVKEAAEKGDMQDAKAKDMSKMPQRSRQG